MPPGNQGTQPSGPGGLIPSQRPEPPVAPRGAEPDQPNLVLLPQNVAVQQDAALLASNAGQGVLVAAPGSTAVNMRIVAAHAGADPAAEGLPLTDGAIVLPGRYGTLTLHADGTYLYRADRAAPLAQGVHGFDAFSYRVEGEGGVAAVATLTVDVAGVNDLPTVAGAVDLGANPGRAARTITVAELLAGARRCRWRRASGDRLGDPKRGRHARGSRRRPVRLRGRRRGVRCAGRSDDPGLHGHRWSRRQRRPDRAARPPRRQQPGHDRRQLRRNGAGGSGSPPRAGP